MIQRTDKHAMGTQKMLKAHDVAVRLNVAEITVYKWCERGVLPYHQLEGCKRFYKEDVDEFIRSRRIEAKKRPITGDSMSPARDNRQ